MSELVGEWYVQYANVSIESLAELIRAANYLDVRPLLELTCVAIAVQLKGKTPPEMLAHLGITNDLTPEQEAKIREEHQGLDLR